MIEIKHRDTGAVIATLVGTDLGGANLSEANLYRAYLSRANLYGADLSRANLSGADLSRANLYGANLSEANLYRAYLSRANLSKANLYGADLGGADLGGANLRGANLNGATIYADKLDRLLARVTRFDEYEFFLFALEDGSAKIKAGCRWMSVADYRAHVAMDYPDTNKARETLRILDYFDACSATLTEPAMEIVMGAA